MIRQPIENLRLHVDHHSYTAKNVTFFSNNFRIGFLILGHFEGGHFDLADRMFHSVSEAWHSASKNNMADVRELIPEFFYLPG